MLSSSRRPSRRPAFHLFGRFAFHVIREHSSAADDTGCHAQNRQPQERSPQRGALILSRRLLTEVLDNLSQDRDETCGKSQRAGSQVEIPERFVCRRFRGFRYDNSPHISLRDSHSGTTRLRQSIPVRALLSRDGSAPIRGVPTCKTSPNASRTETQSTPLAGAATTCSVSYLRSAPDVAAKPPMFGTAPRIPGHQFQRPARRMAAGTNSARMTVASTRTPTAMAKPSSLMTTNRANEKAPNTTTMISAALVIIRPVRCRPSETLAVLSPVCRYSSRTRASRKTS